MGEGQNIPIPWTGMGNNFTSMGEGQNVTIPWTFGPAQSGQGGGILYNVLLLCTGYCQITNEMVENQAT
jgi:hypothetical protein